MAMNVGPGEGAADFNSTINTTPLVDVMLVLLIIFLITIPVITSSIPVALPKYYNEPTQTKPTNIVIAVDPAGKVYWNNGLVPNYGELLNRLAETARLSPQPEVHIRGDRAVR